MRNRRWWDAAVIAASLVIAVSLAIGPSSPVAGDIIAAVAGILLLAIAYVGIARPGLRDPRQWRQVAFVAVAAVALAVGCAGEPFFAIAQAVAYPLAWVLAATRRTAILGSSVLALGVFVGFSLFGGVLEGGDEAPVALLSAAATAGIGLAFAIAFGLWLAGVVEFGEEKSRLLAELTAAQGEIEALSRDRGAARERERLARDIHDTLAQTLAGLTIMAERARRQLADGRADVAADTIATVETLARDALTEARSIVSRTAAVPSDTALADAVERLVDRFRAEVGLTIDLDLDLDDAGAITRDSQTVILRCLQEALANVRKHAGATRVGVRVTAGSAGDALLEISDDGRGFDTSARREGFGLDGMTERVALAGGTLKLTSQPGDGTVLAVRLPGAERSDPAVAQ